MFKPCDLVKFKASTTRKESSQIFLIISCNDKTKETWIMLEDGSLVNFAFNYFEKI